MSFFMSCLLSKIHVKMKKRFIIDVGSAIIGKYPAGHPSEDRTDAENCAILLENSKRINEAARAFWLKQLLGVG